MAKSILSGLRGAAGSGAPGGLKFLRWCGWARGAVSTGILPGRPGWRGNRAANQGINLLTYRFKTACRNLEPSTVVNQNSAAQLAATVNQNTV